MILAIVVILALVLLTAVDTAPREPRERTAAQHRPRRLGADTEEYL